MFRKGVYERMFPDLRALFCVRLVFGCAAPGREINAICATPIIVAHAAVH